MKKDIQYTLYGFYLSETLKDYMILEIEKVRKSILDEQGAMIDEIEARFCEDANRACPSIEYDKNHDRYIFKSRLGRINFILISDYKKGRYTAFKFKDGKRDTFFASLDDEAQDTDLLDFMDKIDIDKDFNVLKFQSFEFESMLCWEEDIETTKERKLVTVGSICADGTQEAKEKE